MYRAQLVLKTWKIKNAKDSRMLCLSQYITYTYKNYAQLCYLTGEPQLSKGKWLLELVLDKV